MKKIILTIAAISALVSCSKSDVEYAQQSKIEISPVITNMTKSMLTGTAFPAEDFNVWAFYKQLPEGTTIAQWQAAADVQKDYIQEKTFTKHDNNLWGGKIEYYWPKLGSLMFVGYYPTTVAGKVDYSFDAETNKMTITEYTPGMVTTNSTHEEDLMYFNMTESSCRGKNVSVVFRHALSWVSVVLAKADNAPEKATIKVNYVKFTGVKPTGTGTVNNSPTGTETNEITWTVSGTVDKNGIVVTDTDGHVLSKGNTSKLAKEPLLIPQTMDGDLVVNYTISSEDNSSFTETKTIKLGTMKDSKNNVLSKWLPAKHYTYTITIGTEEIFIQPTVKDWDPIDVSLPIEK